MDRNRFRILARGLERGLPDEDWRASRESLIRLIQERYPMPRRQPEVVEQKNGATKKARHVRAAEIEKLAGSGFRAAQIAQKLGIGEHQVRNVAREEEIPLPAAAIGPARKLDAKRILEETISGVDAYVSGLGMLEGLPLPSLAPSEITDLMQALSRSINGLRKLRTLMENTYAGSKSTAA